MEEDDLPWLVPKQQLESLENNGVHRKRDLLKRCKRCRALKSKTEYYRTCHKGIACIELEGDVAASESEDDTPAEKRNRVAQEGKLDEILVNPDEGVSSARVAEERSAIPIQPNEERLVTILAEQRASNALLLSAISHPHFSSGAVLHVGLCQDEGTIAGSSNCSVEILSEKAVGNGNSSAYFRESSEDFPLSSPGPIGNPERTSSDEDVAEQQKDLGSAPGVLHVDVEPDSESDSGDEEMPDVGDQVSVLSINLGMFLKGKCSARKLQASCSKHTRRRHCDPLCRSVPNFHLPLLSKTC